LCSLLTVTLSGVVGAVIGAVITYFLARKNTFLNKKSQAISQLKLVKSGIEQAIIEICWLQAQLKTFKPPTNNQDVTVNFTYKKFDTAFFSQIDRPLIIQYCGEQLEKDINRLNNTLEDWNNNHINNLFVPVPTDQCDYIHFNYGEVSNCVDYLNTTCTDVKKAILDKLTSLEQNRILFYLQIVFFSLLLLIINYLLVWFEEVILKLKAQHVASVIKGILNPVLLIMLLNLLKYPKKIIIPISYTMYFFFLISILGYIVINLTPSSSDGPTALAVVLLLSSLLTNVMSMVLSWIYYIYNQNRSKKVIVTDQ